MKQPWKDTVKVEIEKCQKGRICVRFPFNRNLLAKVRRIPGRSYVEKPPKHWHVPLDLESCRSLRVEFGDDLIIGPNLDAWARTAVAEETQLHTLASNVTAELERLPEMLPGLYRAIHLGPLGRHMTHEEREVAMLGPASYQASDVAFKAVAQAPLNANEQGTGKTIEWIATVWEAGLEEGDHLIVCPKAASDGTWLPELEKWQAEVIEEVGIFNLVQPTKKERRAEIQRWLECELPTRWVIVNPQMLMLRKEQRKPDPERWNSKLPGTAPIVLAVKGQRKEQDACRCDVKKGPHEHYTRPFPELYEYQWRTLCIDEAQRGVVRNHKGLTFKSLKDLELTEDGKPCLMSGTPMKKLGGADIWGMLHFLRPELFSSYWQMINQYYEVTDNGFGKKVGLLREDKQEAFFRMLTPFMLRRTKKEVAPWLPEKLYVDVNVTMTPRQGRQYLQMHEEAATMLGREEVTAGGTLDRIIRLKQFANAHCKVDANGTIVPIDSPKVDALVRKFDELGMFEPDNDKKQLVFSQSKRMVHFIVKRLEKEGLSVGVISGDTKERRPLIHEFQNGDMDVMVVVTTAGGVSLTLDAADDVHLTDEMWSPDDDEQAEDRAHRVSRIHQVTVYIYRTMGTVDEDIAVVKAEKKDSHEFILDVRRRILSSRT